jgi:hypothetical protein
VRVATFGASTGWVGRGIDYENGQFTLDGHGVIPPEALLDYDGRGQIEWAYAGLREWVQAWVTQSAATAAGATPTTSVNLTNPGTSAAQHHAGLPGWAIALIVLGVAGVVLVFAGMLAAIAIPAFLAQGSKAATASANADALREGIHTIQVGVNTWAIDHADRYPRPSFVTSEGLGGPSGGYIDAWPANPYASGSSPMTAGTAPGHYTYTVSPDGRSYRLTGYGPNGPVIAVP